MIIIDNTTYNVGVVKVTRKASMKQEFLGTTLDLRKHYDVEGTYYDYEVIFNATNLTVSEYDNLYEALTTPQESHLVTLPYGQATITFYAKVSVASDSVISSYSNFRKWGSVKVTFEALEPQKEA